MGDRTGKRKMHPALARRDEFWTVDQFQQWGDAESRSRKRLDFAL